MGYSPENNPYVPGDPYSYDLKWIVKKFKNFEKPEQYAEAAAQSALAAKASAEEAAALLDEFKSLLPISPLYYGAVGDGIADDTAALQSCIQDFRSIDLQGRTYKITAPLNLTGRKNIEPFNGSIIHEAGTTHNTLYGEGAENIYIHEVTFDAHGNDPLVTYVWPDNVQACAIIAHGSSNIYFIKNKVLNYNYGLYLAGADESALQYGSVNSQIQFNIFDNCNSPVDTYGQNVDVSSNYFKGTTGNAIQIEPVGSIGDIKDPLNSSTFWESAYSVKVSNNYIITTSGKAITLFNNTLSAEVSGNFIVDFEQAIVGTAAAVKIVDNTIIKQKPQTHDANYRPYHYKAAIEVTNALISHNSIFNCVVGIYARGVNIIDSCIFDTFDIGCITLGALTGQTDPSTVTNIYITDSASMPADIWYGCRPITLFSGYAIIANSFIGTVKNPFYFINNATSGVKLINLITTTANNDTYGTLSGVNYYNN